jgi:hypothetical protein
MAVSRKSNRKAVMTIPQLRQSMMHITNYAQNLVKSKKGSSAVKAFQSEWQATFRKPLADKVAKEYLAHIAKYKSKSKTMKHGQKGGMAPLGFRMEPGASLPYGNFPEFLSKGFSVGIPMSSPIANCGIVDSTVIPYPDLGSNVFSKTGGRRATRKNKKVGGDPISSFVQGLTAIGTRPFVSQNPPSFQQDAVMGQKGYLPSPGSDPSQRTWQHMMPSRGLVPLPAAIMNPYNSLANIQ